MHNVNTLAVSLCALIYVPNNLLSAYLNWPHILLGLMVWNIIDIYEFIKYKSIVHIIVSD